MPARMHSMWTAKVWISYGDVVVATQPSVRTNVETVRMQLDHERRLLRSEILHNRRIDSAHEDSLTELVRSSDRRKHFSRTTVRIVNVAAVLPAWNAQIRRLSKYLTAESAVSFALSPIRQAGIDARILRLVQPSAICLLSTLLVDATAKTRHRCSSITINTLIFAHANLYYCDTQNMIKIKRLERDERI